MGTECSVNMAKPESDTTPSSLAVSVEHHVLFEIHSNTTPEGLNKDTESSRRDNDLESNVEITECDNGSSEYDPDLVRRPSIPRAKRY